MNAIIWTDFQICISVPLISHLQMKLSKTKSSWRQYQHMSKKVLCAMFLQFYFLQIRLIQTNQRFCPCYAISYLSTKASDIRRTNFGLQRYMVVMAYRVQLCSLCVARPLSALLFQCLYPSKI